MEAVIFVGPTLPLETARKKLDALYCPPAAQGDVLRALAHRPRLIGIIDGYFDTVPAVWHKEILYAMERGVHVFGAASMGALRAVELGRFGMVGIGQIFEWFKSGQLEDDDEVALAHGSAEAGYMAVSEAMVNIRHAVRQAQDHGLMTEGLAQRFLSAAKNLHYSQRNFRRVLQILGDEVSSAKARELTEYFGSFKPSLKELDAVLLLERAAAFLASDPAPMRVRYAVENTVFLAALINEVARSKVAHSAAWTVALTLGEFALSELPDAVLVRREILLRTLARRDAVRLGFECSDSELEEATQAFAQSHGFASVESLRENLRDSGISDSIFAAMLGDAVLLEKLDRAYDRDLRAGASEHIRMRAFRPMAASSV
jgi:hypothetical protein